VNDWVHGTGYHVAVFFRNTVEMNRTLPNVKHIGLYIGLYGRGQRHCVRRRVGGLIPVVRLDGNAGSSSDLDQDDGSPSNSSPRQTSPPPPPGRRQASIPIFSDTPFTSSSRLLTDGIVAINTAVFVLQVAFPNQLHLTELGVNVHAFVDEGQVWRLLTPVFLHGNVLHLLLNNISLHALGALTEWTAGKKRFVAMYVLSGIGGNVCSYVMTSGTSEEQIASLGASGAIFGLAGALLVFFWRNQVLYRDKAVPNGMFWRLLSTVVLNFAISEFLPDVDVAGHWGGLLSGVLLALVLGPHYELVKRRGQEDEVYLVDTSVMSDGRARMVYHR
jgi:membrane associated rhomboid family serine protease